jgi:serine protease Do
MKKFNQFIMSLAIAVCLVGITYGSTHENPTTPIPHPLSDQIDPYLKMIERSTHAVVLITTEKMVEQDSKACGPAGTKECKVPPKAMYAGHGSGFFISADGLIITNYHVIHNATIYKVWIYDRIYYYEAEVVASDPIADLAMLKLKVPDHLAGNDMPFHYLEIEATPVISGEEVIAIGHPHGLYFSVSKGIVSHPDRRSRITSYVRHIQSTAAINKGNSGGPLINMEGKVVGVNSVIVSPTGEFNGLGHAIRTDTLIRSIEHMLTYGEVLRPAIWVSTANLNPFVFKMVQEEYNANVPKVYGVVVVQYNYFTDSDDTPYHVQQGLLMWDIIIAVNGNPVNDQNDLSREIAKHMPDDVVQLIIIRQQSIMAIDYKLAKVTFTREDLDRLFPEQEKPETARKDATFNKPTYSAGGAFIENLYLDQH